MESRDRERGVHGTTGEAQEKRCTHDEAHRLKPLRDRRHLARPAPLGRQPLRDRGRHGDARWVALPEYKEPVNFRACGLLEKTKQASRGSPCPAPERRRLSMRADTHGRPPMLHRCRIDAYQRSNMRQRKFTRRCFWNGFKDLDDLWATSLTMCFIRHTSSLRLSTVYAHTLGYPLPANWVSSFLNQEAL